MLNVDTIKNGLVIDHIKAGSGPRIFNWLGLDKVNFSAALIMNVPSNHFGKKDIIKIDSILNIDFSILGFLDPNITVNVIQDEHIVRKITLTLPDKVENIIKCKNPRCITSTESYLKHVFKLTDKEHGIYQCQYCDDLYKVGSGEFI